ncbi:hypothetical protein LWI28_021705 [Acer negundo]|uniref:Reverse transcriptase Ty1/copia-type domain-containing protein n=1 Tax=Acer negundo TaxID=4023 RepID=A0AAD5J7P3_ACENE|nr:hypothetical protein LWI28_021705 [Acer negundo]
MFLLLSIKTSLEKSSSETEELLDLEEQFPWSRRRRSRITRIEIRIGDLVLEVKVLTQTSETTFNYSFLALVCRRQRLQFSAAGPIVSLTQNDSPSITHSSAQSVPSLVASPISQNSIPSNGVTDPCSQSIPVPDPNSSHHPMISSASLITSTISELHSKFALKDLGEVNYFLGFEAYRDSSGIYLPQSEYIHDLLSKTALLNSKPSSTPLCSIH